MFNRVLQGSIVFYKVRWRLPFRFLQFKSFCKRFDAVVFYKCFQRFCQVLSGAMRFVIDLSDSIKALLRSCKG